MSVDHDIEVLKSLVAATLDSVKGYEQAQRGSTNPRVISHFSKRLIERKHVATELRLELHRLLGGSAIDNDPRPGTPHRLRATANDRAVVQAVKAGEGKLKREYQRALADPEVSAAVRNLVQRAYDLIKMGHDEILNLDHLIHPAL